MKGALAHHLIKNGHQEALKWPKGSGKTAVPTSLVNANKIVYKQQIFLEFRQKTGCNIITINYKVQIVLHLS